MGIRGQQQNDHLDHIGEASNAFGGSPRNNVSVPGGIPLATAARSPRLPLFLARPVTTQALLPLKLIRRSGISGLSENRLQLIDPVERQKDFDES